LQEGKILRLYLAWLVGHLERESIWKHQIQKNSKTNQTHIVQKGGKTASLKVTPVRFSIIHGTPLTLAQFQLETGRSHQIRVQSAYEGFPILGDKKYTSPRIKIPSFHRLALHSFFLEFPHPMTQEILQFEDPLPEDMSFMNGNALKSSL
jgi:23S rRNA-/tRNA-specific pseudouridylate synthase